MFSQAKDYAAHLPGGELNAREQKALSEMLKWLRKYKKSVCFPAVVFSCSSGCIDNIFPSFQSVLRTCSARPDKVTWSRSILRLQRRWGSMWYVTVLVATEGR